MTTDAPPDLAIPILPSRDLDATLAFYAALGFDGTPFGAPPHYAIATRGTVELHFFAHPALDPATSHAGAYLRVADADAWHAAFAQAGLPRHGMPRLDAVEDRPWGMRECALVDADGNLLRIGHDLDG